MARRRHETLIPLSRDHHDALSLAFRLRHPSPPGPTIVSRPAGTVAFRAASVVQFFADHLVTHFRAEEEVLFPALLARCSAEDAIAVLVRELVAEHRQMEALRTQIAIAGESRGSEEQGPMVALLDDFAALLEGHVRREERELFVLFGDLVPEPEASRLGLEIRDVLDAIEGRRPS